MLLQSEALHTGRLGFPIKIKWCFDQDVKVVPGATFTKRMCDRCGSLQKEEDVVSTLNRRQKVFNRGALRLCGGT